MAINAAEVETVLRNISVTWKKNPPAGEVCKDIFKKANRTLSFCKMYVGIILITAGSLGLPPSRLVHDNCFILLINRKNYKSTIYLLYILHNL